eukprot:6195368-Pleurochrysis_carterae.AAC.1
MQNNRHAGVRVCASLRAHAHRVRVCCACVLEDLLRRNPPAHKIACELPAHEPACAQARPRARYSARLPKGSPALELTCARDRLCMSPPAKPQSACARCLRTSPPAQHERACKRAPAHELPCERAHLDSYPP